MHRMTRISVSIASLITLTTAGAITATTAEAATAPTKTSYSSDSGRTLTPNSPNCVKTATGPGKVTVSWDASTSSGRNAATTYRIDVINAREQVITKEISAPQRTTTITGLEAGTQYRILVSAKNSAGTSRPTEATAKTPSAPTTITNLRTTVSIADGTATASWTPPRTVGGTPITGYRLTINATNSTKITETITTANTRRATFTKLGSQPEYLITVAAINAVGTGTPTTTTVKFLGAPSAPTNVNATAGIGSATTTWNDPTTPGYDAIKTFTITATTTGETPQTVTVPATTHTNTFTNLTPGATYTITVQASNTAGLSTAATSTATIPTIADSPQITSVTPSNHALTLTWDAPATDGGTPVTGYIIRVTGFPDITTTNQQITITGLTNGQPYEINVIAINGVGESAPNVLQAVPVTVPDPITNLQTATTGTDITVTWNTPANSGGWPITDYQIRATSDTGAITYFSSQTTTTTLTGLTPGHTYTITVTANNDQGPSTETTTTITI